MCKIVWKEEKSVNRAPTEKKILKSTVNEDSDDDFAAITHPDGSNDITINYLTSFWYFLIGSCTKIMFFNEFLKKFKIFKYFFKKLF
jgi:hypothetical protein